MTELKQLNIVKHYKKLKADHPDTCIEICKEQKNIESAIYCAAISEYKDGKRHDHQRRISKENLETFAQKLNQQIREIQRSKTFHEIFLIVSEVGEGIKGIGELAVYDTAARIAAFKNMKPDKIYLHAGTRVGAENLLKRKIKAKYIDKKDLPESLHILKSLNYEELEDIFCIYKLNFIKKAPLKNRNC